MHTQPSTTPPPTDVIRMRGQTDSDRCDGDGLHPLRRVEVRYMLLLLLDASRRPLTVAELHRGMEQRGFTVVGRPGKVISDALRTEVANSRVTRTARGTYCARKVTSQRRSRMRQRIHRVARDAQSSQTGAA